MTYRWEQLATYNAERARGLVHTPEWVARMAADQEAFDREHLLDDLAADGYEVNRVHLPAEGMTLYEVRDLGWHPGAVAIIAGLVVVAIVLAVLALLFV